MSVTFSSKLLKNGYLQILNDFDNAYDFQNVVFSSSKSSGWSLYHINGLDCTFIRVVGLSVLQIHEIMNDTDEGNNPSDQ